MVKKRLNKKGVGRAKKKHSIISKPKKTANKIVRISSVHKANVHKSSVHRTRVHKVSQTTHSHAALNHDSHHASETHHTAHPTSEPHHAAHHETTNHESSHHLNPQHHVESKHPSHHDLKEEILEGFEKGGKQEIKDEKKLASTDKGNIQFSADELLRRLFVVDQKKKKKTGMKEKTYLKTILGQAGYEIDSDLFKQRVYRYNLLVMIAWTIFLLLFGYASGILSSVIVPVIASWIVLYPFLLLLSWGVVYFFLDYKKYKRKKELEEVWPEYLQLVVSNINAGMLIDVALWSAVKPRYKVLAKEIEQVAKQTLTGQELSEALTEFAHKFDSVMVQRTINLLIEGMESGGKIATLLNKVSLDIQDTKIMRKEMSASVMTYSIFISFATVVAAPFLFGLSTQLLTIIQDIIGRLSQTSSNSMITFSGDAVKISDFKIFAYVMLGITSFMSAALVGSIRKGSIKDGLKYIPLFMIGTLIIYYVSTILLASLFSGLL